MHILCLSFSACVLVLLPDVPRDGINGSYALHSLVLEDASGFSFDCFFLSTKTAHASAPDCACFNCTRSMQAILSHGSLSLSLPFPSLL